MMLKYNLLTLAIVLFFLQIGIVNACSPVYLCGNWGACEDGIQIRTCQDTQCKTGNVVERRLCAASGDECNPNYICADWGQCHYFGKAQDILASKLRFSGYQERACSDINRCADAFLEERKCTDSYDARFVNVERCGISFVVALDVNSKREVSTISADAWKQQRLDITFVQSNFSFCPTCYNGFKDGDEEEIDCGGSCKQCEEETGEKDRIILVSLSWGFSAFLFILLTFISIFNKQNKMKKDIYLAYQAIDKKDKASLEKHISSIKKNYKNMNPDKRAQFDKELQKLYRRI